MTTEERKWGLLELVHIKNFNQYIAPALNSIGLNTDDVDWERNDGNNDNLSGKYIIKKDNIKWSIKVRIISGGGVRTCVIGLEITVYDGLMPTDNYKLCVSIDKLVGKTEIIKLK